MSDSTGNPTSREAGIFKTTHELTVKSLEQSIVDAEARYKHGNAASDPSPSLNWAVTNQALSGADGAPPSLINYCLRKLCFGSVLVRNVLKSFLAATMPI